ncbi:MAG: NADP oxidoreductase, partial [Thermoanaerobaculia bacterium]|nr:NADP oxidoreductase [Thermoanaerobaculia bacterium]
AVQRVIRAIGYRSEPFLDLPYDTRRGVVPNREGRIVDGEETLTGEYVVGWVKRGPSGLIGSNKLDAKETVENMLADRGQGSALEPTRDGIDDLLLARGVRAVSYPDWLKIDAAEVERGERDGRPRNKFIRVAEMLEALRD